MITVQCEGDLANFVCVGTVGPNPSAERVSFLPKSPLCMLCVCVCVCVCVWGSIYVHKPVYKLKTRRFEVPTMEKYVYYI